MDNQDNDYRSKVFSALKGELGDSFTKSQEEFNQSLDNEEGYANKVYKALKGELGESFNKTEEDFISNVSVKKKEETFYKDPQELGKQLGKRFEQAGSTIFTTKEDEEKKRKADYLASKSKEIGEKHPDFFADEENKKLYQSKLEDAGLNVLEAQEAATTSEKSAETKVHKDNVNKAKSYLKYTSGYGEDSSIDKVANSSAEEQEEWRTEMLNKGISEEGINSAISEYQNKYLTKKGEEKESEYDASIYATAEDRAKQISEDGNYSKEDIGREMDEMLKSRLRSHLPEHLQLKAGIERKSQQLIDEIREKMSGEGLSTKERDKYEAKLEALEQFRILNDDKPERLFDPVTGKFEGRPDASEEAIQYEQMVSSIGEKLTDKEKTLKNAKSALHRFEAMDELYNTEVSFKLRDGRTITAPYSEIDTRYKEVFDDNAETGRVRQKAKAIKSNWVKAKAQFEAVNEAYLTNTDPEQAGDKLFSSKGFHGALGESLSRELGFEESRIGSDRSFANEYVSLMDDLGSYVTPEQRDNAKQKTMEQVGEAVGTSLPIMAEIVASTIVTEGVGTTIGLGAKLKPIKDLFSKKWGKAGKFIYNTVEEGIKGGASFAPTEETFAGGFGEGVTQGIIEGMMGKKGKTLNKFIKYGFKTGGGGVGETIQEYGGQLSTELNREGINVDQAFKNTFGRNIEDATDKLLVTLITSTMMSGAFNAKVLVESRAQLQSDYDEGKIPEDKMADVKEVLDKTAPDEVKAKNELVKFETKPTEETTITKEIKKEPVAAAPQEEDLAEVPEETTKQIEDVRPEVEKIESTKQDETDESRIEEPITEQETGSVTDVDKVEGKPEESNVSEEETIVEKVKEAPKGETLIVKKTRKGETLKIKATKTQKGKTYTGIDKKEVLHTDKNKNTVHNSNEGLVVLNKKGELKRATKATIASYEQEYDYSKGEKAKPVEATSTDEADRHVAETSSNPEELAHLIERRGESEAFAKSQGDTTKEGAIADNMGKRTVNKASFWNLSPVERKGGRKNIHESIPAEYFAPGETGGDGLDIIAQNASETAGVKITEEDVLKFIMNHPQGVQNFKNNYGKDEIIRTAENRFRDVTGLEPSQAVLDKATGKPEAEVVTKESVLEDIKNLKAGNSTKPIAEKAIKAGIIKDADIQEALKPKIDAYKDSQKSFREEFGLDVDDQGPLPFQKGSRKKIAGKKYLGGVIKQLQKALPGVEIEFDTGIDGLGVVRDGKVVINPNKATSDTPIHEFAHVWVKLLKNKNNQLYKTGMELVKGNEELMDFVSANNPHLEGDALVEEALVTAIGEDGVDFFDTKAKRNKLQKFLDKVSAAIRKALGIKKNIGYREMSEMSLKDFTKIASEDLLGGVEISTITDTDIDGIMNNDFDILEDIQIDSDIIIPRKQTTAGRIREHIIGATKSQGRLPHLIASLDSNTRAAINGIMSQAGNDVAIFQDILSEYVKERKAIIKQDESLSKEQVKEALKKETEELLEGINEVLAGTRTINTMGGSETLQDLVMATATLRNNIDNLSKELVDGGYIEEGLVATITDRIGMYLRRSYEIHKSNARTVKEWTDDLPPEVMSKARRFIKDQLPEAFISKVKFRKNPDGTLTVTLTSTHDTESKEVIMSEAEFQDIINQGSAPIAAEIDTKTITKDTKKKVVATKGEIELDTPVDPRRHNINFNDNNDYVNQVIHQILHKHISKENVFGAAGLNKKDISILKKRKDIPKEIRDLLGEIKDPAANYMETVSKMASYIEYSKFLTSIKEEATGKLIWNEGDKPSNAVKISKENNPRWAPLDGMWTTEEFLNALDHFEQDDSIFNVNTKGARFINATFALLNTYTKANLTKWNPGSNVRNHIGAYMMSAKLGYTNPYEFAQAYSDFWTGMSKRDSKGKVSEKLFKPFDRSEFEEMKRYGMIDDGVGYNTYKDSMERAKKFSRGFAKRSQKFKDSKTGKVLSAPKEFTDKFYLAPDAAAKIFVFRKMKADYSKALKDTIEKEEKVKLQKANKETIDKAIAKNGEDSKYTLSVAKKLEESFDEDLAKRVDTKLNEKTANVIKATMPTYSQMSKAAKTLSRSPVIGAFASFTTETVRNTVNQAIIAAEEIKEGNRTGNQELRKLGAKKILGLVASAFVVPTISLVLRRIMGISHEDEEDRRTLRAEWEKNSWTLPAGKGENGEQIYTDLSYTDPMSVFNKPLKALLTAAMSDDMTMLDGSVEALKESKNQFFGQEPLWKTVTEVFSGEDQYGRKLTNPAEGNMFSRGAINAWHGIKSTSPRILNVAYDSKNISGSEETEFGTKKDLTTYLLKNFGGTRYRKENVVTTAKYKIKEAFDYNNNDAGIINAKKLFTKSEDRTEEDLKKANEEYKKVYNLHKQHLDAARSVGATEAQIRKMLNSRYKGKRNIPEYWAKRLMSNAEFKEFTEEELLGTKKRSNKRTYKTKKTKKKKSSPFLK